MKKTLLSIAAAVCAAALCAFAGQRAATTEVFVKYTVRAGESVSLICIDHFGYWSADMGKAITRDNPSIKDINVITVGQVLVLRNPYYKGEKAAQAVAPAAAEQKVAASQGVVTCVEGDALVIPKGAAKRKLAANTIVYPGDIVVTLANGRVEIIVNRETVVRLKENTRLTVEAFRDPQAGAGKTKMGFTLGSVWAKIKRFQDKVSRFDLELPTAIAGVHGTVYEASIEKDSSSEVKVFTGEVAVKNNPAAHAAASGGEVGEVSGPGEVAGPSEVSMDQWVTIVHDMQKIRIDKKGKPKPVEDFKRNEADSWEKWNIERDRRIGELFEESE
jgi:FecR protein